MLFVEFRLQPYLALRAALLGLILLTYGLMFWQCRVWLANPSPSAAQAHALLQTMRGIFASVAATFGLYLIALMAVATPHELPLLYAVTAGSFATALLIFPAICALIYWSIFAVCGAIAFFISPPRDLATTIIFALYTAVTGFSVIAANRRLAERTLSHVATRENADLIKLLLHDFEENASDWLWETGPNLRLRNVSERLAQAVKRSAADITGIYPLEAMGINREDITPGTELHRLNQIIRARQAFKHFILKVNIAGEERYHAVSGKPVFNAEGKFCGYHGVGSDVTAERRQQDQITFLSRHDALTRMPNRMLLTETLSQMCTAIEGRAFALFHLDLDDFKPINDTHGHAAGDAVLVAVADRIRACLRTGDVPSRLGADEFALIHGESDPDALAAFALKLIKTISAPYQVAGQTVQLGVSIGITIAPKDGNEPGALLQNADLALTRAKSEGRGQASFYDPQMDAHQQYKRALKADLRVALERGEFRLDFQPIMDFASQKLAGAEALLRWHHPERGLMSPADFIPLIEESGLIGPVGEWVLRQACAVAATWPAPLVIAVNLSPLQFRDSRLAEIVLDTLATTGLPAHRLELEITESSVLETDAQTKSIISTLHTHGVRIALDDFGTGYSSLSYLQRYPFNKIKIDRSFIRRLDSESGDASIVLAILGLADRLHMIVTAEGVETPAQASLLGSYGCHQAQGYLYHRPMPQSAIATVIANENTKLTQAAE
jgi:diguanylate cyclase (GGDEF)-like protein